MIDMKRSLRILLFVSPFAIAGLLYLIFQFTDPATIGPGGVLGVFILLYLGCLTVVFILLRFGLYWMRKLVELRKDSKVSTPQRMGIRKAYYIASVIAFAPVTFLAMHAYSQLRVADVALVVIFIAIVTFYIVKRR